MPRTRTADPEPFPVAVSGRSHPLSHAAVARVARKVLRGEGREAALSITFLGQRQMAELNSRWKRRASATDVLAFPLASPRGGLTGDVYICPAVASAHARALQVTVSEELRRLVVHGVLHVLGYDHPAGSGRTRSAMWRRQERYVGAAR